MSSLFYTLEGWPSSPASDSLAHRFNNDTGIWDTGGAPAATPFTGQVVSTNSQFRQMGGWDGAYWYVGGPDGKLYRYNPVANTWSAALAGGAVLVAGTVEDQHWTMASDGRFLYHYTSGGGFRRYDPAADAVTLLTDAPGTSPGPRMFLVYDGTDTLYFYKGDQTGNVQKYTISTGAWTTLPNVAGLTGVSQTFSAAFLQGKLWVVRAFTQQVSQAYAYDPSGNTWASKSTVLAFNAIDFDSPFGEVNDSTLRTWCTTVPGGGTFVALDYNVLTDTWSNGPVPIFNINQGGNWAVTRAFTPLYSWFLSDGVTPMPPTLIEGLLNVGTTTYVHLVLQTPTAKPSGAVVSVPTLVNTDAASVVTVSGSQAGPFTATFTTPALLAGQSTDVWVQITPSSAQTLGLTKFFNLKAA